MPLRSLTASSRARACTLGCKLYQRLPHRFDLRLQVRPGPEFEESVVVVSCGVLIAEIGTQFTQSTVYDKVASATTPPQCPGRTAS